MKLAKGQEIGFFTANYAKILGKIIFRIFPPTVLSPFPVHCFRLLQNVQVCLRNSILCCSTISFLHSQMRFYVFLKETIKRNFILYFCVLLVNVCIFISIVLVLLFIFYFILFENLSTFPKWPSVFQSQKIEFVNLRFFFNLKWENFIENLFLN